MSADGCLFKVVETGRLELDGLPDFYQAAFHTRAYVEQTWSRFFRIDRYVENGMNNDQDVVVLVKAAGEARSD